METDFPAQNVASSFVEHRELLGKALLNRGMLSRKQLDDLVHRAIPHLTFKQAVSLRYEIPIEVLDRVDLEDVVLPGLSQELRARLQKIANKDRFSKNLDIARYLVNIETRVLHRETRSIESRIYDSENEDAVQVDSHEVTEATVEVMLATTDGKKVPGKLRISHDSHSRQLTILQEDEDLKSALYYTLRQAFTKKS